MTANPERVALGYASYASCLGREPKALCLQNRGAIWSYFQVSKHILVYTFIENPCWFESPKCLENPFSSLTRHLSPSGSGRKHMTNMTKSEESPPIFNLGPTLSLVEVLM